MRLLFTMAQPYVPLALDGAQSNTRSLALALAARGHFTAIAAEMPLSLPAAIRAAPSLLLSGGRFARASHDGVTVFRARAIAAGAPAILNAFRPDCVIVQAQAALPVAHIVNARRIALVVAWHDVASQRHDPPPTSLTARFVANSRFTADFYAREYGLASAVIPPLIRRDLYGTTEARRSHVTFVNPKAETGLELALTIAEACPDIPFEFVEFPPLRQDDRHALQLRLRALPNVTFTQLPPSMRQIYGRTCILLDPSPAQESWARTASEAQVSGIPVIGTQAGGNVESIGPGGILMAPGAPAQDWIAALRELWDNADRYAELSALARKYAQRKELDQDWAVSAMLAEIAAAIAQRQG